LIYPFPEATVKRDDKALVNDQNSFTSEEFEIFTNQSTDGAINK
jgi:hypothetical protein